MSKQAMLEIHGLRKCYGSRLILDNLDLQVEQGDIYGFLGPNGAGKTTTLRSVLGLVHFQEGTVILNGYDITKDFKKAIRKVGAVVETPRFYENYSGYTNLKLMADFYPGISRHRIHEVLEIVGMQKRAGDKVQTYSLGMKQRLGIARALLHSPDIVILDEPTNGLDPQGIKEIRETIAQLAYEQNITFLISTHLLSEVEVLCTKVGILKQGRKIAEGSVKSLLKRENETLEVHTAFCNEAIERLSNIKYVQSVEAFDKGVRVELMRGFSDHLIRVLVEDKIPVRYAVPKNQTLEEFYIGLTEGGDHHA